jgi:hypothetical protein
MITEVAAGVEEGEKIVDKTREGDGKRKVDVDFWLTL